MSEPRKEMTDEERKAALKKWRNWAMAFGVLLGLVCKSLPHEYQSPCEQIAHFCRGVLP